MTTPIPRRRRPKLTFTERRWLLSGKPGAIPFLEGGEWARRLWRDYGAIVTERFLARPHHLFKRPLNWWRMERGHDPRPSAMSEFDYLSQHPHLLIEAERRHLARQAQRLDQLCRELDDRA
jgi:hypothetical protein